MSQKRPSVAHVGDARCRLLTALFTRIAAAPLDHKVVYGVS
jgi:serine/threonine protein phosphatase PrpC